jgi:ABC-type transport system substrate-binding protein
MNPKTKLLALALAGCALAAAAQTAPSASSASPAPTATERKVLNVAFRSAETGFDPSVISDIYSRTVTPHIFEALYSYDHLARPAKIKPLIALAMPEHSPDFKVWTIRIKPGIYFASDPAFKGKKREVVAQDFVYAFQRIADPANKSQLWGWIDSIGYVGLAEARKAALDARKPFDYDQPIEGVFAPDRTTIRFTLKEPRPRFIESIAGSDLLGAQAREVVEFYGDKIAEHPVGSGPFRLKQWRRSSLIVLERNPEYREVLYDAEPAPDDAPGQAILAQLKGRKLPLVDEVRVSIIEEAQPYWLSFLNAQIDSTSGLNGAVPGEYVAQSMPNGKVAPNLAKRGIGASRVVTSSTGLVYFNMEDPVVGGYTPDKVALRRAISLAQDIEAEIRLIRRNLAIPAQSPVSPNTTGYDPAFKSENSEYNPARAKALLDLYGYVDKDGDGYRELPDGKPLVIVRSTQPESINREFDTMWKKNLDAVGIKTIFNVGKWAEQLKSARAGKLQIWSLSSSAASLDGHSAFMRYHGPQAAGLNLARFKNAEFDAIYERMQTMPDGPERQALFVELKKIAVAFMPYRSTVHGISTDMWHPWVIGFRRPLFWNEWWHMVDVDMSRKPAS